MAGRGGNGGKVGDPTGDTVGLAGKFKGALPIDDVGSGGRGGQLGRGGNGGKGGKDGGAVGRGGGGQVGVLFCCDSGSIFCLKGFGFTSTGAVFWGLKG